MTRLLGRITVSVRCVVELRKHLSRKCKLLLRCPYALQFQSFSTFFAGHAFSFCYSNVLGRRSSVTMIVRSCVVGYGCELFGNLDQSVEKLWSHDHPPSCQHDIVLGNLQTTYRLCTIQRNRSETSHLHSRPKVPRYCTSLDLVARTALPHRLGILRVTCRRFLGSQSTRPKSQAQRRSEFSVCPGQRSLRELRSPGQSAFLQRALSLLQPGRVWVTLKMWTDSPDIFYLACSDVVRYEIDEPMALYGAIPMIWAIHRLEGNWSGGWVGWVLLFSFRGFLPSCRLVF